MTASRPMRAAASVFILLANTAAPAAAAAPDTVQVRASAAFGPCLFPALEAFTRATRVPAVLTVAEPDPPEGADVVVGDDAEMTRLLEGGTADLATSFDLGEVPWVTVGPPGSPAGALAASGREPVAVLGGKAGRDARAWLGRHPRAVDVTDEPAVLRAARQALVPRSLAGDGEAHAAGVRPLVATAAAVSASPRRATARQLLAFLASDAGRLVVRGCFDPIGTSSQTGTAAPGASTAAVSAPSAASSRAAVPHAAQVVDWWLPQCSLTRNRYNDPAEALGPPDARSLGGDNFQGFISLGQGGFVTVDMGTTVTDGSGPEIRVYQTTTGEPVTLYASAAPAGPFVLVGLRVPCGVRSAGVFSNHCDFDLAEGAVASARYFKVEDGEIYPCLAGGTVTEGADLDAVEILNSR
jgi:hypothetical protein